MTRTSLFSLASIALLSSVSALSQQSSSPAPRPGDAAPKPAHGNIHDVQYRALRGGDPGMRPELRIAPPGMWWKRPEIAQKLSLTADQQKRMDDIFQQSRLQLIDLKANVEKQEVILEPMLSANPPDTNKVLAQIDHVAAARAELEKANARMLLGIRGVLSADQWTKLQAEQRDNMRFMFHFKGGPDGPDGFRGGPNGPGPDNFKGLPKGPMSRLMPPTPPAMPSLNFDVPEPPDAPLFDLLPPAAEDDLAL